MNCADPRRTTCAKGFTSCGPHFVELNTDADFFDDKAFAVVSHGLVKEASVPPQEIARALARKKKFEDNPEAHTFRGQD